MAFEWTDADTPYVPGSGENAGLQQDNPLYSLQNLAGMQDWNSLGFQGDVYTPNGEGEYQTSVLNPELENWMNQNGYSVKGGLSGSNLLSGLFKNGNLQSYQSRYIGPDAWENLATALAGGILAGPMAGGLGSVAKGALTGSILGGSTASDPTTGFLTGMAGGSFAGLNPAASLGLDGMGSAVTKGINAGLGGVVSNLAAGNNLSDSVKAGATTGLTAGAGSAMNDFFKGLAGSFLPTADSGLDGLQGSGGDMSGQTDASPNTYQESTVNPTTGVETYNPNYRYNDPSAGSFFRTSSGSNLGQETPNNKALSFSVPSASQLGNFAVNNAGTLAQMLYGIYNNRKQNSLLGNQINSLTGLYGQNSAYAQQLRAKLNAQAAAAGKRSNTSARETQLQALLADKAASLSPSLYQMQLGQNNLNNQLGQTILQGIGKLNGLGDLFGLGSGG